MKIDDVLSALAAGEITTQRAKELLSFTETDVASIDNARVYRKGFPETIFGEGKTSEQILAIAELFVANGQNILITRVDPDKAKAVQDRYPDAQYNRLGRTVVLAHKKTARGEAPARDSGGPYVAIVAAGTSDLPVVEECFETIRALGHRAVKIVDVGVAGIHRLYARLDEIKKARVVVVVAGMEGALTSVVGGLVERPVIAVPTSVGYGASFGGLAPLLTMLNSCAPGVSVVNIDNGYGAAYCAAQIMRAIEGDA